MLSLNCMHFISDHRSNASNDYPRKYSARRKGLTLLPGGVLTNTGKREMCAAPFKSRATEEKRDLCF